MVLTFRFAAENEVTSRDRFHEDKIFFYRKKEDEFRSRIGKESRSDDAWLAAAADGWARLRSARETIRLQMNEIKANLQT